MTVTRPGPQTEVSPPPASGAVNLPGTVAEVRALADAYEAALTGNDVPVLEELFWDAPHTVRVGAGEELFGTEEIAAFRRARPTAGLDRTRVRTEVTTFGTDMGVTTTLFVRDGIPGTGRQTQTWLRFPQGWRVVAAHVSQRPATD
ncbi:oxalurate catabolism protein HpxZ [Streptomyces sp. NBC_00102]|uniref:oxalurate catabolism protein HpxZ n=1 Tax=Streptomyces sp. NBC_00102 TaxID=2975652 RepID=UPI0022549C82|nr:oxalurate catabolism protein HpxZ [Streptomyces sp. NBC_00102]MCX5395541.1 oxalurate catabolism protein HpxZ [Streptomyces sp. NBC_00102]